MPSLFGSGFDGNTGGNSIFGANAGGATTRDSNSIFGATTNGTIASGVIGTGVAGGCIFGTAAPMAPFGSGTPRGNSCLLGGAPSTITTGTTSIFGPANGNGSFGAPANSGSNIFGGSASATTANVGGIGACTSGGIIFGSASSVISPLCDGARSNGVGSSVDTTRSCLASTLANNATSPTVVLPQTPLLPDSRTPPTAVVAAASAVAPAHSVNNGPAVASAQPNPNEAVAALASAIPLNGTSYDKLHAPAAPLFGVSYDALAHIGELASTVRGLPATRDGYTWLHGTALARLGKQEDLDVAFHLFRLANDLHVQIHGCQWSSCLYNMACCESSAVTLMVLRYCAMHPGTASLTACTLAPEQVGGLVAPTMPPCLGGLGDGDDVTRMVTTSSVCEARLDAAASWLHLAIATGFNQHAHAACDTDLEALRQLRAPKFAKLMQLMQCLGSFLA